MGRFRGLPGIQDNVMPPELQVRPTRVIEYGSPETNVVEPNSSGTLGTSVVPHEDLWRVGLDPMRRVGGDPASTAMVAGQAFVGKMLYDHRANQAPMTHILEREGGSRVTFHEPSIADQEINVSGVKISNGVEGLEKLLRNVHRPSYQESPIRIRESRTLVQRFAQGMSNETKASMIDVIRRLGQSGSSSIQPYGVPGVSEKTETATESGVVASLDGAEAPLKGIMFNKARQQIGNSYRPSAKYHPAQSGYASSSGQYRWPVIGQGPTQGAFGVSYLPAGSGVSVTPTAPANVTPIVSPSTVSVPLAPIVRPITTATIISPTASAIVTPPRATTTTSGGSGDPGYSVTMVGSGALPKPAVGTSGGSSGSGAATSSGETPPTPGTGSEDTCSVVLADGTTAYVPCADIPSYQAGGYLAVGAPGQTNWLMIGGIALGVAALIGGAIYMARK